MSAPTQLDPAASPPRGRDAPPWHTPLALAARLLLGVVALVAGLSKIGDLPASVRAVRAFELLPEQLAVIAGTTLPMIEIVLGVLLLLGLFTRVAAIGFGLLLVAFSIAIVSAWARGLAIDCGCFGGGGPVDPAETTYLQDLLRDLGMIAAAAVLVIRPRTPFSLDRSLDLSL